MSLHKGHFGYGYAVLIVAVLCLAAVAVAVYYESPSAGVRLAKIASAPVSGGISTSNLIALVNAQRIAAGLPSLKENTKLDTVAKANMPYVITGMQSNQENAYLSGEQENRILSEAGYSASGFDMNYAHLGPTSTIQNILIAWMSWPPDKEIILNPAYTETGVDIEGGYVIEVFANPL